MAAGAASYYDLPYDELYDAVSVEIALTYGFSDGGEVPEHPDELAVFEGRLISFRRADYEDVPLDVGVPVRLCTYRSWSSALPDFDRVPSPDLGSVALGIGPFDEGQYNCRVVVLDEAETQTQMLLMALLSAGLAGEPEVKVTLSGRRDQPSGGGLVGQYAWDECGVEAEEFGEALDAREHEPPLAHFESMAFEIKVDVRQIAKRLRSQAEARSL